MTTSGPRLIAVTGGPGAGKTTVLHALGDRGYTIIEESARSIIARRLADGLSPRPDPAAFAEEILAADLAKYEHAASAEGIVFFDRSLLDALGMVAATGTLSDTRRETLLNRYPLHPQALIFPPWEEIYCTDTERDQTFEESVRVFDSIGAWYRTCGYDLIEIPPGSVAERARAVLAALGIRPDSW